MTEVNLKIPVSVLEWCRSGSRGLSSESIVEYLFGLPLRHCEARRGFDHPHDPDDLTRCIRLLEACPEVADRFHLMAGASPAWGLLLGVWDELVATLDEELPHWRQDRMGTANRTYRRMRQVLDPTDATGYPRPLQEEL